MPGARSRNFRLGDRSELLVQNLLAGFAFTTPVPRQEDVGIDFLCSLIEGDDGKKLLKAGPFFAVRAKSSERGITYNKPHELEWIKNQEHPLLLCVANRRASSMDVYSTWNLLCGVLGGGWEGKMSANRITLRPGKSGQWPGVMNKPDGSQEILLGKPIMRITHNDIVDETRTKEIAEVVRAWVTLDRANIVDRYAGMYWVVGPDTYQTGKPPNTERLNFYWNPQNLEKCTMNLCKSATALWLILRRHDQISTIVDLKQTPWPAGLAALKEMVRWCQDVYPPLQGFIGDLDVKP